MSVWDVDVEIFLTAKTCVHENNIRWTAKKTSFKMHSDYGDSYDYVQDVQIWTYFSYSYLSIWQLENP